MTSFENLSAPQKSRAALHRDVQAICQETCHYIGLEISKHAMELVAEMVFKKLSVYGTDLEAFAKHAKRTSINNDDVKLLVRRCSSLKANLNKLSTPNSKEKKRKSKTAEQTRKESLVQTSKQLEAEVSVPTNEDVEMDQDLELVDCVDLTLN